MHGNSMLACHPGCHRMLEDDPDHSKLENISHSVLQWSRKIMDNIMFLPLKSYAVWKPLYLERPDIIASHVKKFGNVRDFRCSYHDTAFTHMLAIFNSSSEACKASRELQNADPSYISLSAKTLILTVLNIEAICISKNSNISTRTLLSKSENSNVCQLHPNKKRKSIIKDIIAGKNEFDNANELKNKSVSIKVKKLSRSPKTIINDKELLLGEKVNNSIVQLYEDDEPANEEVANNSNKQISSNKTVNNSKDFLLDTEEAFIENRPYSDKFTDLNELSLSKKVTNNAIKVSRQDKATNELSVSKEVNPNANEHFLIKKEDNDQLEQRMFDQDTLDRKNVTKPSLKSNTGTISIIQTVTNKEEYNIIYKDVKTTTNPQKSAVQGQSGQNSYRIVSIRNTLKVSDCKMSPTKLSPKNVESIEELTLSHNTVNRSSSAQKQANLGAHNSYRMINIRNTVKEYDVKTTLTDQSSGTSSIYDGSLKYRTSVLSHQTSPIQKWHDGVEQNSPKEVRVSDLLKQSNLDTYSLERLSGNVENPTRLSTIYDYGIEFNNKTSPLQKQTYVNTSSSIGYSPANGKIVQKSAIHDDSLKYQTVNLNDQEPLAHKHIDVEDKYSKEKAVEIFRTPSIFENPHKKRRLDKVSVFTIVVKRVKKQNIDWNSTFLIKFKEFGKVLCIRQALDPDNGICYLRFEVDYKHFTHAFAAQLMMNGSFHHKSVLEVDIKQSTTSRTILNILKRRIRYHFERRNNYHKSLGSLTFDHYAVNSLAKSADKVGSPKSSIKCKGKKTDLGECSEVEDLQKRTKCFLPNFKSQVKETCREEDRSNRRLKIEKNRVQVEGIYRVKVDQTHKLQVENDFAAETRHIFRVTDIRTVKKEDINAVETNKIQETESKDNHELKTEAKDTYILEEKDDCKIEASNFRSLNTEYNLGEKIAICVAKDRIQDISEVDGEIFNVPEAVYKAENILRVKDICRVDDVCKVEDNATGRMESSCRTEAENICGLEIEDNFRFEAGSICEIEANNVHQVEFKDIQDAETEIIRRIEPEDISALVNRVNDKLQTIKFLQCRNRTAVDSLTSNLPQIITKSQTQKNVNATLDIQFQKRTETDSVSEEFFDAYDM